jgi:hypothetical protein
MVLRTTTVYLLVVALLSGTCLGAGAQDKDKPPPSKRLSVKPLASETLKHQFDTPEVPEYSGNHHFLFGTLHRSDRGASYTMDFASKDQPANVLEWYKSSFSSYKWKIRYSNNDTISAGKDGNICTVNAEPATGKPAVKGEKCRYSVSFFLAQRRK